MGEEENKEKIKGSIDVSLKLCFSGTNGIFGPILFWCVYHSCQMNQNLDSINCLNLNSDDGRKDIE